MSRAALGVACLLVIAGCAVSAAGDDLLLNLDPLQSAFSSSLILLNDREARFYDYDRYQRIVRAAHGAPSGIASSSQLWNSQQPLLRELLKTKSWGQPGVTEGDQFWLESTDSRGSTKSAGGAVDALPPHLRKYLQDLTEFGRRLPLLAPSPGYFRSLVVDAERRRLLSVRGKSFTEIGTLPPVIQAALQQAARHPGDFASLTPPQWRALSSPGAPVWEYVLIGPTLFHSQLFSAPVREPPARRDK